MTDIDDAPFDAESFLPLPLATFHILLVLRDGDRHGYALLQEIAERTGGELELGPATLYRSIHRLLEQGLVQEVRERPRPALDDPRRRYYRLTAAGAAVARAEAARLARLLALARRADLAPEGA